MMFQDKVAVAVKVDGKVQREDLNKTDSCRVMMKFGSEYSIMVKNMNDVRIMVSIEIDGKDIMPGRGIIVDPGKSVDIERFIDSLKVGNRFKFIEKTEQISEYRGNRIEDGLIKISWQKEMKFAPVQSVWMVQNEYPFGGNLRSRRITSVFPASTSGHTLYSCNAMMDCSFVQQHSPGITVQGSESDQQFIETTESISWDTVNTQTMIISLIGVREIQKKPKKIFQHVKVCENCGSVYNSEKIKFCSVCGTNMIKPEPKEIRCKECSTLIELKPNMKFCFECGTQI